MNPADEPPTMIPNPFLLVITRVILKLLEEAHCLVKLFLQISIAAYLGELIFG